MNTDTPNCRCKTDCGDDPALKTGALPCKGYALKLKGQQEVAAVRALVYRLGYPSELAAVQDLAAIKAAREVEAEATSNDSAPDRLFVTTKPGELDEEVSVRVDRRAKP